MKLEIQEGFSYEFKFGQIVTSPTSYSAEGQLEVPAAGVVTHIFRVHDASGIKELVMPSKMLDIPYELEEKTALVNVYEARLIEEQVISKAAVNALEAEKAAHAETKAAKDSRITELEAALITALENL